MPSITIRNLPEDVHRDLKRLARKNDRSTEAEVRHILRARVLAARGEGLGQALKEAWGTERDFVPERAKTGPRHVDFG